MARQVLVAENGEQAPRTLNQTWRASAEAAFPMLILLVMNRPILNGLAFTTSLHP